MAELQRLLQSNEVFRFEPMKAFLSGLQQTTTASPVNLNETTGALPLNANVNLTRGSPGFNANLNTTNLNTTSTITIDNQGHANINTNVSATVSRCPVRQETDTQTQATPDPNANVSDVARLLIGIREETNESEKVLLKQITDTIVGAHLDTTINTHANVLDANERIKESNEQVDSNNPSLVWKQFTTSMVPELTKVINFCKMLPGFSEVNPEDQIQLIKQGSFEVMVTRISLLIDEVSQEMLDPQLKMKCKRDVVRQMPMGPLIDQMFQVAEQLNPLRLTDGEYGLFTAALLISPDRTGLQNVSSVKTIQKLYLRALYQLLKQTHNDPDKTFRNLLSLLPLLNQINQSHIKFLNNIKDKSPEMFSAHFPQLHQEVFVS
ncbi:thyroid hormone receptor alpha-like [Biomphalaria glabrata]|uniref:Thyroid hormone receptor alpha-like n=1 Tax=Biomphalaria glabrata TaxID=6526 RepID=A0A9U8EC59_BIOGL|nr:thyroid hormone receptor alpha-like [Biomphalaria glabrata]